MPTPGCHQGGLGFGLPPSGDRADEHEAQQENGEDRSHASRFALMHGHVLSLSHEVDDEG